MNQEEKNRGERGKKIENREKLKNIRAFAAKKTVKMNQEPRK